MLQNEINFANKPGHVITLIGDYIIGEYSPYLSNFDYEIPRKHLNDDLKAYAFTCYNEQISKKKQKVIKKAALEI